MHEIRAFPGAPVKHFLTDTLNVWPLQCDALNPFPYNQDVEIGGLVPMPKLRKLLGEKGATHRHVRLALHGAALSLHASNALAWYPIS